MSPFELKLHNTLSRRVEAAAFDMSEQVRMYTCGPTVYRPVHLGNLRSYLLADVVKRLLLRLGYQVRHVKNVTDVGHMRQELLDRGEDKVIAEALSAGLTPRDIARRYTEEFLRDELCINILPADVFPRATQHVARMIEISAQLLSSGHAYERAGNVYFRVSSFHGYGELGGAVSREGQRQGVRAEADPLKDDPRDFALWKAAEAGRTELVWDSPWGRGFPGWHIECTAMSTLHLGPQVDIHTGGVDNIFPHHEDERAQSESLTGVRPFARVWLHGQHLLADGLKMAKSTGNAYTLADLLELNFEPLAFRYLCLTAHYRARLNFTFTSLRAAQTGLRRLRKHVSRWGPPADQFEQSEAATGVRDEFWATACNDLGLPRCLAMVWSLARGAHKHLPDADKAALAREFDLLLGLELATPPPRRAADPLRGAVSSVTGVHDSSLEPNRRELSVIIAVQPAEDLVAVRRSVRSVLRYTGGVDLEVVVVDATGSPAAHAELAGIAPDDERVRLVWIDHDPGAGAARNLGLRSSRGAYVCLLDPSIELLGLPWTPLMRALDDRTVGAAGGYGLLTADMRHFHDAPAADGPVEVDALQNYLIVLRRSDLLRIGPLDEHYRYYRILDLDFSYTIRERVGRLLSLSGLPLRQHRHALWEALSEGDREERSRKNFGRFLKRWDHKHELLRHGDARSLVGEAAIHG